MPGTEYASKRYPSELTSLYDYDTRTLVWQLTSYPAIHHHFYPTNTSFDATGTHVFFVAYRNIYPYIYALSIEKPEILQLTDEKDINPYSPCVTPDGGSIFFTSRTAVCQLILKTGKIRKVARFQHASLGTCSVSTDGRLVAFPVYRVGGSEVVIVDTVTGRKRTVLRGEPVNTVQFSPTEPGSLLYHGGYPHTIGVFELRKDRHRVIHQADEGAWAANAVWSGNGEEVLFVDWPHRLMAVSKSGPETRTILESSVWHVSSSRDGSQIVADTHDPDLGLLLINASTGEQETVCRPGATNRGYRWRAESPSPEDTPEHHVFRSHDPLSDNPPTPNAPETEYGPSWSHPHPVFSPDDSKVLFTSDGNGYSQLRLAWLD